MNIANSLEVTLDEFAYGSLIKNANLFVDMIDDILADCTPGELKSLSEVLKTTKEVLRKNG